MKNTKKAFKKACELNIRKFNYKKFKKKHPELLKCILSVIKDSTNSEKKETVNFTNQENIFSNFKTAAKISTIETVFILSDAFAILKKIEKHKKSIRIKL